MKKLKELKVCYLLLAPADSLPPHKDSIVPTISKDAPYFYDLDIAFASLGVKTLDADGIEVAVRLQVLDNQVWLAECYYTIVDPLKGDILSRQEKIQKLIKEALLPSIKQTTAHLSEEYSIYLVSNVDEPPNTWFDKNAGYFAHLLRSSEKPLDASEIKNTLATRVYYSAEDATVVDWNGAIIFTSKEDFQSDIDLFKIGNYQMLRYRLLDKTLDTSIKELQKLLSSRFNWFPKRDRLMYDIAKQRLYLLLSFEKIDQSLLLIGDWYSAQLYRAIVNELYINDWKKVVSEKLENLRSVHEIVTQNLTLSWERLFNSIQLVGWFVLLVGYFVLYFWDIKKFHL